MAKKELMIVVDYIDESTFSLDELCQICHVSPDFIYDLVRYEIIYPKSTIQDKWVFDVMQLQRVKTVLRLQRDLEMNLAGVAVVLDLLNEMEKLRAKAELLERYILR